LKATAYFFYFNIIYELTALKLGWWYFPKNNQFLGEVTMLGLSFPVEELFFFIIFGAAAVLATFELFDEDHK